MPRAKKKGTSISKTFGKGKKVKIKIEINEKGPLGSVARKRKQQRDILKKIGK